MLRRLEELGLVKRGTWDWFAAHGGITNEQARQVLGEPDAAPGSRNAGRPLPFHIGPLAAEVHRQELLSEERLARFAAPRSRRVAGGPARRVRRRNDTDDRKSRSILIPCAHGLAGSWQQTRQSNGPTTRSTRGGAARRSLRRAITATRRPGPSGLATMSGGMAHDVAGLARNTGGNRSGGIVPQPGVDAAHVSSAPPQPMRNRPCRLPLQAMGQPVPAGNRPDRTRQIGTSFVRMSKKSAGRTLDGRTWNELPHGYSDRVVRRSLA